MKKFSDKSNIVRETMILIGVLGIITLICRLWPLLLLMILSLFVALIILLFRATDRSDIIASDPEPLSPTKPSKICTQSDVYEIAYTVILRQITQLVHQHYPQARWIWEASNALQLIENGDDVFILLNRAGGYRRAKVVITNLHVTNIIFEETEHINQNDETDIIMEDDDLPENYELLAFEWVEAHIIEINNRCNEAIGTGKTSVLIYSDELPVKESWADVCKQLAKAEIENSECVPDGIQINLAH